MRRKFFVLALLLLAGLVSSFTATPAQAHHRHGWGWGHHWGHGWGWGGHRYHGWGHHNWGFGRGYVYRPFYRPYYGVGYRGFYRPYFGGYYNSFYPTINYGYSNYGFSGCYCPPVYSTGYSTDVYYDTQYSPAPAILNYYGQNGGVSQELTAGAVIAQFADAIRQQRAANPSGPVTARRIFDGDGRLFNGDGRVRNVVQNIAQGIIRNEPLNQNPIIVRSSNIDSRSKARAYMTQGDNLFREQRYGAAAQQYRAAASLAPDVAEANWRYAHTLVAMGEFDLAVNAAQRAIAASADISRNGFTLDTLYGTVGTAKDSHLERLAQVALDTDSANAHYLLGLTLHYSGEPARAEKFFVRAAELQGSEAPHVAAFLNRENPSAPRGHRAPPPLLARVPMSET